MTCLTEWPSGGALISDPPLSAVFVTGSVQYDPVGGPAGQKDPAAGRGKSAGGVWPDRLHKCEFYTVVPSKEATYKIYKSCSDKKKMFFIHSFLSIVVNKTSYGCGI